MAARYAQIGVCGLSCRLCPSYHSKGKTRCRGCKSRIRMSAGCPFITCAVKRKEIEFCWECGESGRCGKWKNHRRFSLRHDTFTCYQKLEDNIASIGKDGVDRFEESQKARERLLVCMLNGYNEGRCKTRFTIAATVMEIGELKAALSRAADEASGLSMKERARVMRAALDSIAARKGYILRLRR